MVRSHWHVAPPTSPEAWNMTGMYNLDFPWGGGGEGMETLASTGNMKLVTSLHSLPMNLPAMLCRDKTKRVEPHALRVGRYNIGMQDQSQPRHGQCAIVYTSWHTMY